VLVNACTSSEVIALALTRPADARTLVVFATSHHARDRELEALLNQRGLATAIVALDPATALDCGIIADRFAFALDELAADGRARGLSIALLGEAAAATAAIVAAASQVQPRIAAIVAWNGRPDLLRAPLATVRAPTLFVAGSRDTDLLRTARAAGAQMTACHDVVAIPGVSREFAATGAIAELATILATWVARHAGERGRIANANDA
jgi:putative phosphoribosyl transferase